MFKRGKWRLGAALACCAPSSLVAQPLESTAHPSSPCAATAPSADPSVVPEDGVTATYAFQASGEDRTELQSFIARVVGEGFGYVEVALPTGSMLFVSGSGRLPDATAVADELARACRLQISPALMLVEVQYQSVREKMRLEEEEARKQQALKERRRLADDAFRKRRADRDDIEEALQAQWDKWAQNFHLGGTLFGRVRDSKCEYVEGHYLPEAHFDCVIGVTATSKRGPEYEQGFLHLRRPGDGTLEIFYPAGPPPT